MLETTLRTCATWPTPSDTLIVHHICDDSAVLLDTSPAEYLVCLFRLASLKFEKHISVEQNYYTQTDNQIGRVQTTTVNLIN
jgi:hypothetical protein